MELVLLSLFVVLCCLIFLFLGGRLVFIISILLIPLVLEYVGLQVDFWVGVSAFCDQLGYVIRIMTFLVGLRTYVARCKDYYFNEKGRKEFCFYKEGFDLGVYCVLIGSLGCFIVKNIFFYLSLVFFLLCD